MPSASVSGGGGAAVRSHASEATEKASCQEAKVLESRMTSSGDAKAIELPVGRKEDQVEREEEEVEREREEHQSPSPVPSGTSAAVGTASTGGGGGGEEGGSGGEGGGGGGEGGAGAQEAGMIVSVDARGDRDGGGGEGGGEGGGGGGGGGGDESAVVMSGLAGEQLISNPGGLIGRPSLSVTGMTAERESLAGGGEGGGRGGGGGGGGGRGGEGAEGGEMEGGGDGGEGRGGLRTENGCGEEGEKDGRLGRPVTGGHVAEASGVASCAKPAAAASTPRPDRGEEGGMQQEAEEEEEEVSSPCKALAKEWGADVEGKVVEDRGRDGLSCSGVRSDDGAAADAELSKEEKRREGERGLSLDPGGEKGEKEEGEKEEGGVAMEVEEIAPPALLPPAGECDEVVAIGTSVMQSGVGAQLAGPAENGGEPGAADAAGCSGERLGEAGGGGQAEGVGGGGAQGGRVRDGGREGAGGGGGGEGGGGDGDTEKLNMDREQWLREVGAKAGEVGWGPPYAPPGWRWRVGHRHHNGKWKDRYLISPDGIEFNSKKKLLIYLEREKPDLDRDAFLDGFDWSVRAATQSTGTETGGADDDDEDDVNKNPLQESRRKRNRSKKPAANPMPAKRKRQKGAFLMDGGQKAGCRRGNAWCVLAHWMGKMRMGVCDICCREPGFCRGCSCLLCGEDLRPDPLGVEVIRCMGTLERRVKGGVAGGSGGATGGLAGGAVAKAGDGACLHAVHLKCAMENRVAGVVWELCLDAEYLCRACETVSNLMPMWGRLIVLAMDGTDEGLSARTEMLKTLTTALHILKETDREDLEGAFKLVELVIKRLKRTGEVGPCRDLLKEKLDLGGLCGSDFAEDRIDRCRTVQTNEDGGEALLGALRPASVSWLDRRRKHDVRVGGVSYTMVLAVGSAFRVVWLRGVAVAKGGAQRSLWCMVKMTRLPWLLIVAASRGDRSASALGASAGSDGFYMPFCSMRYYCGGLVITIRESWVPMGLRMDEARTTVVGAGGWSRCPVTRVSDLHGDNDSKIEMERICEDDEGDVDMDNEVSVDAEGLVGERATEAVGECGRGLDAMQGGECRTANTQRGSPNGEAEGHGNNDAMEVDCSDGKKPLKSLGDDDNNRCSGGGGLDNGGMTCDGDDRAGGGEEAVCMGGVAVAPNESTGRGGVEGCDNAEVGTGKRAVEGCDNAEVGMDKGSVEGCGNAEVGGTSTNDPDDETTAANELGGSSENGQTDPKGKVVVLGHLQKEEGERNDKLDVVAINRVVDGGSSAAQEARHNSSQVSKGAENGTVELSMGEEVPERNRYPGGQLSRSSFAVLEEGNCGGGQGGEVRDKGQDALAAELCSVDGGDPDEGEIPTVRVNLLGGHESKASSRKDLSCAVLGPEVENVLRRTLEEFRKSQAREYSMVEKCLRNQKERVHLEYRKLGSMLDNLAKSTESAIDRGGGASVSVLQLECWQSLVEEINLQRSLAKEEVKRFHKMLGIYKGFSVVGSDLVKEFVASPGGVVEKETSLPTAGHPGKG
ncbi:hypothetical protein CBR_g48542 [Chara braunii]|uniref:MBD domain-containing protein n=1 Tax=Chara braunii TaxID=69332 RepID=A0A388M305_CHABU|nr:hypothetical protein CBR_g48542 [Chara braunii]|eukprot:GBG88931.1 hypothetical protein CBR_g48542 [Chara braunii]